MFHRTLLQVMPLALALLGFAFHSTLAAANDPSSHEGTVVSATAGKLVMADAAGKQHTHAIDESTKITVNGKPGKLADLQMSMKILVTTEVGGKVLSVSTVDKHKFPAN